jgi:hypothetical protein
MRHRKEIEVARPAPVAFGYVSDVSSAAGPKARLDGADAPVA